MIRIGYDGKSDIYLPFPANGTCMLRLLHLSVQNVHFGEILIERYHLLQSMDFFFGLTVPTVEQIFRFSDTRMILSCVLCLCNGRTLRVCECTVCGVVTLKLLCVLHILLFAYARMMQNNRCVAWRLVIKCA